MKTLVLSLVAILGIGPTSSISAVPDPQTFKTESFRPESLKPETIALRAGTQRTTARGELTIKFVTVMEDSRCPVGVNCVWAGNAKIRLKVTDRRGRTKMMELNTNAEPKIDQVGRYSISVVNLTPKPVQNRRHTPRYNAMLSIQRVSR
jgi:hypothetical protein